jgi:Uma2 family endonuclease
VISPPNSEAEMAEKRRLYFEQGAQEVWICDDAGTMFFFAPAGQLSQSQLIPEFPLSIEI